MNKQEFDIRKFTSHGLQWFDVWGTSFIGPYRQRCGEMVARCAYRHQAERIVSSLQQINATMEALTKIHAYLNCPVDATETWASPIATATLCRDIARDAIA